MTDAADLMRAEQEFLLYKAGQIDMELSLADQLQEGAWTGSMGGHDPDFQKLKNGLATWWREKAATDPHPFAYCVKHLSKKFGPNVNRICAWLKDQALGTTKWRNGQNNKGGLKEAATTCEYCSSPATKMVENDGDGDSMSVCSDHVAMAKNVIKNKAGAKLGDVKDLKEAVSEELTWEPSKAELVTLAQMFSEDNPDDTVIGELAEFAATLEETGDEETPDPEAGATDDLGSNGEGTGAGETEGGNSEAGNENPEAGPESTDGSGAGAED